MNIQSILQQLSSTGLSDADIGNEIGAAASIVQRLRKGTHKSTSLERGIKIIEFHKRVSRRAKRKSA